MDNEQLPSFDTLADALDWMFGVVDDECIDNTRFARVGNDVEEASYVAAVHDGCCGSYDTQVLIAGEQYLVGCNYGH